MPTQCTSFGRVVPRQYGGSRNGVAEYEFRRDSKNEISRPRLVFFQKAGCTYDSVVNSVLNGDRIGYRYGQGLLVPGNTYGWRSQSSIRTEIGGGLILAVSDGSVGLKRRPKQV